MPVQSPVPNQSVEEILASIRQAIADDEARRGRTLTSIAPPSARTASAAARNLSSANDDDDWDIPPDFETQNVIDLAIEKAIDGVSAALNESTRPNPSASSRPTRAINSGREEQRSESRAAGSPQRPLLSARSGAAVAASFEDLSRNVASLSAAEVRDMAQEMLRPMLKGWLDDNLPGLVERLVRDEIERVSRGR
jgi:hypothetical protein